ncbi:endonuclease/exonuclease/phosphatase family protein [Jhaorihella thermophila]
MVQQRPAGPAGAEDAVSAAPAQLSLAPAGGGALDRIAHSEGLAVRAFGVHDARPAHIASDHLPIWADILPAPA